MVAKRKKLLMVLYSKLVKSGKYYNANGVLQYLLGINRSKYILENVRFWCLIYNINFSAWFKND